MPRKENYADSQAIQAFFKVVTADNKHLKIENLDDWERALNYKEQFLVKFLSYARLNLKRYSDSIPFFKKNTIDTNGNLKCLYEKEVYEIDKLSMMRISKTLLRLNITGANNANIGGPYIGLPWAVRGARRDIKSSMEQILPTNDIIDINSITLSSAINVNLQLESLSSLASSIERVILEDIKVQHKAKYIFLQFVNLSLTIVACTLLGPLASHVTGLITNVIRGAFPNNGR